MPGYTTEAKNMMLTALVATIDEISLHTASPGDNGANEVTGGGYARMDDTYVTWAAASGGEVLLDDDVTFLGPASTAVTHFGIWDGATFLGGGQITGDAQFNSSGEFVLQAGTRLDLNLEC